METQDFRSLASSAQEAIRMRAVKAVLDGVKQVEAARNFGVTTEAVRLWMRRYERGGFPALKAGRRGRPKGGKLLPWQAATIVRMITDRMPDQLKLPFALWTRQAVAELIERKYGIVLSRWTVGRYLKHWGFSPQKPAKRAIEQNPARVKAWLETEYPQIKREATQEDAEIHWGDEMGIRSDHQSGKTWGRKGRTPVVAVSGRRFSCNMISTITNRGTMRFMIY
jgi:transposase